MAKFVVVLTLLSSLFISSLFGHKGSTVLNVISPKNLKEDNTEFTLANFGYVPWGKTQLGNVYLVNPPNGCTALDRVQFDPFDTSPILMLQRGGCAFTQQAYNAQNIGARMVILIDDRREPTQEIEMIDDHTGIGKMVHIPTIMVSYDKGKALGQAVQAFQEFQSGVNKEKAEPVTLQITFNWPKEDKAFYEFWITPTDTISMAFMAYHKDAGNKLMDTASWQPHYPIMHCHSCRGFNSSEWLIEYPDCLGGGRYCAYDPDGDRQMRGRDVLEEMLRQICIFNNAKIKFFDYVEKYNSECFKYIPGISGLTRCSEKSMKVVGIDSKTIFQCVDESFEDNDKVFGIRDNKLLREELKLFQSRNLAFWPVVIINNNHFKGSLMDGSVFQAICMGFKETPRACKSAILDPEMVVEARYYNGETDFWFYFGLVLVILIVSMIVFFFIYRRMVRRAMVAEMNDQINAAVATYFRMSDVKDVASPTANEVNVKIAEIANKHRL